MFFPSTLSFPAPVSKMPVKPTFRAAFTSDAELLEFFDLYEGNIRPFDVLEAMYQLMLARKEEDVPFETVVQHFPDDVKRRSVESILRQLVAKELLARSDTGYTVTPDGRAVLWTLQAYISQNR
jgi:hypothetical protein